MKQVATLGPRGGLSQANGPRARKRDARATCNDRQESSEAKAAWEEACRSGAGAHTVQVVGIFAG